MRNQNDRLLNTKPNKTLRNPYLVNNDDMTVAFQRPLWQSVLSLALSVPVCALGCTPVYWSIFLIEERGFEMLDLVGLVGLLLVWFGICTALSSGASKITFDLTRRTYDRILLAPPPLLGRRTPDTTGWGNPFTGRTLHGQMSEFEGVQIIERQETTSRSSASRVYPVYVMPLDRSIPPCVVYSSASLQDAQAQLREISSLLSLPMMKTLLMDSSNPLDYKASKEPARNPYLARFDGQAAVFRLPRSQTILMFALGLPVFAFMVTDLTYLAVLEVAKHGAASKPLSASGEAMLIIIGIGSLLPISISLAAMISSGANAITLDLVNRSYRRLLLGPPWTIGQKHQNFTGQGNLLQRQRIDGAMSEIEGVTVLQAPYGSRRLYSVQLIWAENVYPPFVVYYGTDQQEASLQALEVGRMLNLPQIEQPPASLTQSSAPWGQQATARNTGARLFTPNKPRSESVRNHYLVNNNGRTATFRTPLWRKMLVLSSGLTMCVMSMGPEIASLVRFGTLDDGALVFVAIGIMYAALAILSSGANEIAFDLKDRTYRRILLPPSVLYAARQSLMGLGNPIGGKVIAGQMSEIEGVHLVESPGNQSRSYSVQIVWADRKYPPCVINFLTSLDAAQEQVREIASLLDLPILEPSLY